MEGVQFVPCVNVPHLLGQWLERLPQEGVHEALQPLPPVGATAKGDALKQVRKLVMWCAPHCAAPCAHMQLAHGLAQDEAAEETRRACASTAAA